MEKPVFRAMDIVNRLTWAFCIGVCVGVAACVLFEVTLCVAYLLF